MASGRGARARPNFRGRGSGSPVGGLTGAEGAADGAVEMKATPGTARSGAGPARRARAAATSRRTRYHVALTVSGGGLLPAPSYTSLSPRCFGDAAPGWAVSIKPLGQLVMVSAEPQVELGSVSRPGSRAVFVFPAPTSVDRHRDTSDAAFFTIVGVHPGNWRAVRGSLAFGHFRVASVRAIRRGRVDDS